MASLMQAEVQKGYSLLALIVLTMILGFGAHKLRESESFKHGLALEQQARQSQILEHIRSSLLGFAANQGLHSQSHLGHMPCPALAPGSHAQTSCQNKTWGHLPVTSKTAVNYLNAGIDARNNELELSLNHHWMYAVSIQLVQPNSMGWGRWVDYSKPSITVRIPSENNRTENYIAAVVANKISQTNENQFEITAPYALIYVDELQNHMKQAQIHHIKNTLKAWQQLNPEFSKTVMHHENMALLGDQANLYQPRDSGCNCRCTKTRCTCGCTNQGSWASLSPCLNGNENCTTESAQVRCTSKEEEACVFSGPAGLMNLWPVTHFEPVAASNKSCRPTRSNQCPLSRDNNACTCHFSWPDNTRLNLEQFSFKLPPTP